MKVLESMPDSFIYYSLLSAGNNMYLCFFIDIQISIFYLLYINIYFIYNTHIYTHTYIYKERERGESERERERERETKLPRMAWNSLSSPGRP